MYKGHLIVLLCSLQQNDLYKRGIAWQDAGVAAPSLSSPVKKSKPEPVQQEDDDDDDDEEDDDEEDDEEDEEDDE